MQYSYSECRNCEVYGFCSGTEEEHSAYMENFAWHEKPAVAECETCEAVSYCTQTDDECDLFNEYRQGDQGPASQEVKDGAKVIVKLPANKGLVNRLIGCIVEVDEGDHMARVTLKVGENLLTTIMPVQKFRETGYRPGDQAAVAFKALNVKMML
ncbi:hypothetical protein ASZ90_019111 [hydrocarbon metagenome]|uniref:Mop domain-containing protein n=1 Tax=hydrocarbon metagenome TaxID=938273 RepID=A0A0W8E539_9ZZZZ